MTGCAYPGLRATLAGVLFLLAFPAASSAAVQTVTAPPAAITPSPRLLPPLGHTHRVRSLAVSRDGRLVLTGSEDSTALLWSFDTGRVVERYSGHDDKVMGAAFSPDERHVVTGSLDRTIRVWDTRSGQELKRFRIELSPLGGGIAKILAVAYSPDGRFLLCGTSAGMLLLNAETGSIVEHYGPRGIQMLRTDINAVAFSPDGRQVAAGYWRGIYVWETESGEELHLLEVADGSPSGKDAKRDITSVMFTPDGQQIVAGSEDSVIHVWDAETGRVVRRLVGHSRPVRSIALSRDGRYVLSGSEDETARLWDLSSGKEQRQIKSGLGVWSVAFGKDDQLVLVGTGFGATAWDTATGKLTQLLHAKSFSRYGGLAISGNGRYLVSGTSSGDVQVWDLASGHQKMRLAGHTEWVNDIAVSANSRYVVSAAADKSIRLWNLETGREVGRLDDLREAITGVDITHDGQFLLAASDRGVEVWSLKTGEVVHRLQSKFLGLIPAEVSMARFSSDGEYIVASFLDPAAGIGVWNLKTGEEVRRFSHFDVLSGHRDWIRSAAISPDGRHVFSASDDKTARMWNIETGLEVQSFQHDHPVSFVVASGNGEFLLTASNNTIHLWDIKHRKKVRDLSGHWGRVTGLALTPDGRYVVSASGDGTTRFWDLRASDGQEVLAYVFVNERDWIAYTPDGLFDGTPDAWKGSAWRIGTELESVPVERFFSEFFYPDLVPDVLAGKRPMPTRQISAVDRRPPEVELGVTDLKHRQETSQREVTAEVYVRAAGDGQARDVRLFRNGTLVHRWRGEVLAGQKLRVLTATVRLVAGENVLSAYAFNSDNVKSEDAEFLLTGGDALRRPGVVHIVSIGVNTYDDPSYQTLVYSEKDAREFAVTLASELPRANAQLGTRVTTLLGGEATKINVMNTLRRLGASRKAMVPDAPGPAQPEDVVIVFFSGHGVAHGGAFYLIPRDVGRASARAVEEVLRATAVSNVELEELFAEIDAGRLLLVIDACNSGRALDAADPRRGPMNVKGLAQLAYDKGINILTASQSYQVATAASDVGGGLLATALIRDSLRSRAPDSVPRDGRLDVQEWYDFASRRVPEMHDAMQKRAQEARRQWLARRARAHIPALAGESAPSGQVQTPRAFYRRDLSGATLIIATLPPD